jgi:hypothetical protein
VIASPLFLRRRLFEGGVDESSVPLSAFVRAGSNQAMCRRAA